MKYIKTYESITSTSYGNDKEFIKNIEDNITTILVDMLDDGYNIGYKITDYGGNIGYVTIQTSDWYISKTIHDYLDTLHTLIDYLRTEGYDIHSINLNGWIEDKRGKSISFRSKEWSYIEKCLLKAAEKYSRKNFSNIFFYITPLEKKF